MCVVARRAGDTDADHLGDAVTDAILGAARAGDIVGDQPDTDPHWKDASSIALLQGAVGLVRDRGLVVGKRRRRRHWQWLKSAS